jgi:hypothetical protein
MKAYRFATVRPAAVIIHMQPIGNRHTLCGRIAEHNEDMAAAARAENFATRRLCKTCARVTPARDTSRPVDSSLSKPTNTWTVTDRAGNEIARVYGETMSAARNAGAVHPVVRETAPREGGFAVRRLTAGELRDTVDTLVESAFPTYSLVAVLRILTGSMGVDLPHLGRVRVCESLAARGALLKDVRRLHG